MADKPDDDAPLCPFCGADGSWHCDLENEAGVCPWEECGSAPRPVFASDEQSEELKGGGHKNG